MNLDAVIQEAYQRWWFSGFVLPVLFGATIGTAFSIYTNWVTSRLILFRQEIQRAKELALGFIDTYRTAILQTDRSVAEAKFQWILFLPALSLKQLQQQPHAGAEVSKLGNLLEGGAMRSWDKLNNARGTVAQLRAVEEEAGKLQEAVFDLIDRLGRIRPDYWRLFGAPSFGSLWRKLTRR